MARDAAVQPRTLAVVIAGGGTGGHLYPGIAVATELQRRLPAAVVTFAGTARGIEARIVPKEGFELDFLRSAGLKGKSWTSRFRGALLILPGFVDSWRLLSRRRPNVVVGVGGYSSGPVVLTAALRGIPTLVLEQNAQPGLTNRILARVVRAAAVTYAETLPFFRGRAFVTGNPVRKEFLGESSDLDIDRSSEPSRSPRLLILGGSQGAHAINMAVVAAAPGLVGQWSGLQLVHQTGERDLLGVREAYTRGHVQARAEPFLDHVADEMRRADLVICRAGATTLAELAAIGRPAVLIPFPGATDDHQRRNARVLEEAGAAIVIDERDLTEDRLGRTAAGLLDDAPRRATMSRAMKTFARRDAASRIVDRLLELAGVPGAPGARTEVV